MHLHTQSSTKNGAGYQQAAGFYTVELRPEIYHISQLHYEIMHAYFNYLKLKLLLYYKLLVMPSPSARGEGALGFSFVRSNLIYIKT